MTYTIEVASKVCGGNELLPSTLAPTVSKQSSGARASGIGVLILDSYTTRKVTQTCGMPDFHWGRGHTLIRARRI